MTKSLDAALEYASQGFRVFPLVGKRPITERGFKDATTDPDIIKAWWRGHPEYGVGIAIPDDYVVIDTDSPEAETALSYLGMDLPETMTAKSRNGKHFWYRRSHRRGLVRAVKILPNVDILINGYVVAPPSRHPEGGEYVWITEFDPSLIAPCPEWVYTIESQNIKEKEKVDPDKLLEGVPIGQRQVALFRYACWLRADPKRTKKEAKILVKAVAVASGSESYDTDALVDRVWDKYLVEEEEVDAPPVIRSLADLAAANLPPSKFIVNKMIPIGVNLIFADSKAGKSLLAAKVFSDVSAGRKALELFDTQKCGVLYLDLEQGEAYALERWVKIINGGEWPSNLYTAFEWKEIDAGGLDMVAAFVVEHPHVRVVVFDTLADIWPIEEQAGSTLYHKEQQIMKRLKKFVRDYDVAVVLVHHTNKAVSEDWMKRASGSSALIAKADSVIYLDRDVSTTSAVLRIKGKNFGSSETQIEYDEETLIWKPASGGVPLRHSSGDDSHTAKVLSSGKACHFTLDEESGEVRGVGAIPSDGGDE